MAEGYVKVYRALLEWEWYTDVPTRSLFEHLRLRVNWKAGNWMGIDIAPGSTVTSYPKLARESGLTEKQVRRALRNLVTTGEVVLGRAGKGQLVTLRNWAKFQGEDEQRAGSGQGRGRERAPIERREEGKNVPKGTPVVELFGEGIDATKKTTMRESSVGVWDLFRSLTTMREAEAVGVDVSHYFQAILRWSDKKPSTKRTAQGWLSTVEGSMARDKAGGKLVLAGAVDKADAKKAALMTYHTIGTEHDTDA